VTSSQPVVTPTALNFTPDNKHCYAMSGNALTAASLAFDTLLEFTTQSEYIMGNLVSYGATDIANPSQGAHSLTQILFNDISLGLIKLESGKEGMQAYASIPLLIPPFTKVTISLAAESANWYSSVTFSGEAIGMTETGFQ